ncbi:MAG: tRNA (N(6)-L-threonylcarbamoyladenosine(37)-C(2))-methylthiotransferase MtaB [Clostridia bacterium]|nr:tRNA (N(6)-L-threonylcarbamoyladenosine(37)-C(2))-methylthiotransferase MtaB [Clostridia bacterium]
MKKVAFLTLGCRVNQYETQAVREALLEKGFQEGDFDEVCDAYVINTCAVTAESERKGRQMIRRALRMKEKNPDAVVCACGCFSQGKGGADPIFDEVDVLTGNTGKSRLATVIATLSDTPKNERERVVLLEDIARPRAYEPLCLSRSHNARAFIKIQDGCNSFCTYCYVPLVRGRVRSRRSDEILAEARRLGENGYREVVLTGIETGAYGEDLATDDSLLSLVEALQEIPSIERIRFGSLKPSIFTEAFCTRLSRVKKVLPHFHLSLQSGSDRILRAMGRRYSRREEEEAVRAIEHAFPDAGLSADLICGFPGETEEDFRETLSLVDSARLLHTHIFPYSPREGTRAAAFSDQVDQDTKRERAARLLEKAKESSLAFAEKRVGREYRVLCERIRHGYALGYTENFIYTETPAPEGLRVGDVFPVILTSESEFSVETLCVSGKSGKEVDNSLKKL